MGPDASPDAVRTTSGPVSIGGGRFSMGGQTATEGALHVDMRRYNRITHNLETIGVAGSNGPAAALLDVACSSRERTADTFQTFTRRCPRASGTYR